MNHHSCWFLCHFLTQLKGLKTIRLCRRHFRATCSERLVAACCCQLYCLRYIDSWTFMNQCNVGNGADSNKLRLVRIILKTHFFTNQAFRYMKAVNAVNKTPSFWNRFPECFYLWIRRICEFRCVDDWNGIFSNSVMCAVSFHPDSCGRGPRFTSVAELPFKEHVTLKHLVYWRCKQRRVSLAGLINLLTQCKYSLL